MVFEVIMLHEDKELIYFVESYYLSTGNNDPTEVITLVLIGITVINQLFWLETEKKE